MTAPEISVLLTSWNTLADTRRCLKSLHATGAGMSYEVIAVDNGSRDGSAELLAADERVQLIRNPGNVGFAPAMNQAYRAASGELVLLLNSDVQFHRGTLSAMVAFLREHPDVAGVSPLYVNLDGTLQQHYVQLPGLAACLGLWTTLRRAPGFRGALDRFRMQGEDFSKPRELSSGSGLLLRTGVLEADSLFDERFPIYWNDAILTRRLQAAGHQLWMTPDAVVTHNRGASCRLLGPAIRFRHLLGGTVCYLRATQPRHKVALFRIGVTVDYLLKTVLGRTTTLGWADLQAALRGDVGPLPDGDTRNWEVHVGTSAPQYVPGEDTRVLVVNSSPSGKRQRRFVAHQAGPSLWRGDLPGPRPAARWLPPLRWISNRLAAARLRNWLDGHAGERTVRVDERNAYLVGWLGEDVPTHIEGSRGRVAHGH